MATFKGEEFKFPDEQSDETVELNEGGKVEVEIEAEAPTENKKVSSREDDPTDEELHNAYVSFPFLDLLN